jgi:mannan endo-1,4-beta-mannosidase
MGVIDLIITQHMNKKIPSIIILSLILFTHKTAYCQASYLYQVGLKDSLYSSTLREERVIWVQLPENYAPESHDRYPVIYVLDGAEHLKAVSTVLSYYWGGFMPEMVIVGISNRANRARDLTPSQTGRHLGMAFNQESGGAERFTAFIEKELIPYVENRYPVTGYRTLIGHSLGGLFAIHILVNHTDLFDNFIAIDPSLDRDNQKLLKESEAAFGTRNFEGKSLFMSLGGQLHMQDSEITLDNVMLDSSEYTLFARSNIEFSNSVQNNPQNGLNFYWKFYKNDIHGTVSLPSIMDGLLSLFSWYPIEHTDRFNSPDTPIDELVQIIRSREKKLKDHFGYFVPPFDEDLLIILGNMNMDWGNTQKSLEFFQLAAEYFPESADAYNSLADFYMAQGDPENALANITRAFSLSGEESHKLRMDKLKGQISTASKTLEFMKSISGKMTLAGQHNKEPNTDPDRWTRFIKETTGKYPALWSGDFLFQQENIEARWNMIHEARNQWEHGAVINLMWHACPPDEGEPCGWDPGLLNAQLSDEQWAELITDGSPLNEAWKARMDDIAIYLQYLEDNGVEVLFRPLHEMNQGKFWWGGRPGPEGTARLYQITHDYFTETKGLENLIWVWDMQDLSRGFEAYNPGDAYWDLFGFDIYGEGYDPSWYNYILPIAGDKPMAIGECARLPSPAILEAQPRWVFFMPWAELVQESNTTEQILEIYNDPAVITRDEMPGWN